MGELLKSYKLCKYFDNNCLENSIIKFSFKYVNFSKLFLHLEKIDGRKLYPFSINFHKLVYTKFNLIDGKTYYIWYDDIHKFNEMSAIEQLTYINNMTWNSLNIGEISSQTINKEIASLLNKNVFYEFEVTHSDITESYWLSTNIDNITISIWAKSILNNSNNILIELDHDIKKEKYKSLFDKVDDFIYNLEDSSYLKTVKYDCNQLDGTVNYQYYYTVFGFIKDSESTPMKRIKLFNIYLATESTRYYLRVKICKKLTEYIDNCFDITDTKLTKNITNLYNFINSFCNNLSENSKFDKIISDLQEHIEQVNSEAV